MFMLCDQTLCFGAARVGSSPALTTIMKPHCNIYRLCNQMIVSDRIAKLNMEFGNIKQILPFRPTNKNPLLVTYFFFSS